MLKRLAVAGLLAVVLAGCSGEKEPEPVPLPRTSTSAAERAAVTKAFNAYRTALLAEEGEAVAALLTAESIEYYAALKKLALTAPEAQLRQARMSDQIAVIQLRATVPAENIRAWSPAQLVADSVERGQFNAASVQRMSPGTVDVSGEVGSMLMKLDGKESPLSITFYREGGQWKLQLMPLLESVDAALRARARELQVTERRMVDNSLATLFPPEKIRAAWVPAG